MDRELGEKSAVLHEHREYTDMSLDELNAKLAEFEALLEEYLDEREMMLGQTGQHVGSTGLVKKYAALIGETEDKIKVIRELIEINTKH